MRVGCFLVVVTLVLIVMGAQGLYEGLTNPSPTVLTYREFREQKPTRGWFEISDARLNLIGAVSSSARLTGKIKKAYIPVESATDEVDGDDKVHLLLVTQDPAILQTLGEFSESVGADGGLIGKAKRVAERGVARARAEQAAREAGPEGKAESEAEAEAGPDGDAGPEGDESELPASLRFLVENRERLLIDRPVRGTLQFGMDAMGRERRQLGEVDADLADDFVVMQDGKAPATAMSAAMLGGGLLLGFFLFRRTRSADAGPSPDATGGGGAGPQPAPTA